MSSQADNLSPNEVGGQTGIPTIPQLAEKLRQQSQHLQDEYLLQMPFDVVDAALFEYLNIQILGDTQAPYYKRHRLTGGSTQYALRNGKALDAGEFADLEIRMVGQSQTYIAISLRQLVNTAPPEWQEYLAGYCKLQLFAFLSWLWTDQKHMAELAKNSPTAENSVVQSIDPLVVIPAGIDLRPRVGRPRGKINDWARQEIQRGRNREDVFREYVTRSKIDPTDELEVANLRDRFRKALERTKSPK